MTLLSCLALLCGCLSADAKFKETRQVTVPHESGSGLRVVTNNGALNVQQGPVQQVQIEASLSCISQERLTQTTIVTNRADGKLNIEVAWPGGKPENNEGCSFNITVPDATGVEARTSNGQIRVTGLSGAAVVRTSNGAVTVTGHDGGVEAHSSNGRIALQNNSGELTAHTSNGAIEISGARRSVEANTSNGRIHVELADESPGPLKAHTSNGAIDLVLGKAFVGELKLATSNGGINLGGITTAKKVSVNRESANLTFGESAAVSDARTSNGGIQIRATGP
jgi:DUF4097 and DUF4098 domain-containing protein YvlB